MAPESAPIPPSQLQPNYHAPNPLYPTILATVILCTILTTLLTLARLTTKLKVTTFNLEDYFLIAAWAACTGYGFLFLAAGQKGLGQHIINIQPPNWDKSAKFAWALELLYVFTIWLAKTSLIFQLIRIFAPAKTGVVYWACHALIWGNLMFYTAILFALIFECWPISALWENSTHGHCVKSSGFVVSGAVNVLSDLLNILLPIWATWHLQMPLKRKAGIVAVFGTGLLAFMSSICRLVYSTSLLASDTDISYLVAQVGLWALAEIATVIICTCFPMMPRFIRLLRDRYPRSVKSLLASWGSSKRCDNAESSGTPSGDSAEEASATRRNRYERIETTAPVDGRGLPGAMGVELATWAAGREPTEMV